MIVKEDVIPFVKSKSPDSGSGANSRQVLCVQILRKVVKTLYSIRAILRHRLVQILFADEISVEADSMEIW